MQQLKEMYRKEADPDNKVRLDLGDEERKKKLEELAAESDPLTRYYHSSAARARACLASI